MAMQFVHHCENKKQHSNLTINRPKLHMIMKGWKITTATTWGEYQKAKNYK